MWSAFLAQAAAVLLLALDLGDWLALAGQLASLALLGLVAWKVRRGRVDLSVQVDLVARRAQEERRAILARLDELARLDHADQ